MDRNGNNRIVLTKYKCLPFNNKIVVHQSQKRNSKKKKVKINRAYLDLTSDVTNINLGSTMKRGFVISRTESVHGMRELPKMYDDEDTRSRRGYVTHMEHGNLSHATIERSSFSFIRRARLTPIAGINLAASRTVL